MKNKIVLKAVGDIVFNNKFNSEINDVDVNYPFLNCKKLVKDADISLVNLEGPVSQNGTPITYKSSLRTDPFWFEGIKNAGFNFFNLSNNHMYDYEEIAINDTITLLNENNLQFIGYGENSNEAKEPVVFEKNGIKIGFLSFCSVVNKAHLYATENKSGISLLNENELINDIEDIKTKVDIVILILHWGLEQYNYPTPDQIRIGHKAINAGASLIIGHHSHTVQGIERYKNGIIAYSLGNFLFDHIRWEGVSTTGDPYMFIKNWDKANKRSILIESHISKNGIDNFKVRHFKMDKNMVPIEDSSKKREKELQKFSKLLGTNNYNIFWKYYSSKMEILELIKEYKWVVVKIIKKPHALRWHHVKLLSTSLITSFKVFMGKIAR